MHGGQYNVVQNRGTILCHEPIQATSDGFWNGGNPLSTSLPLFMLQICLIMATTRLLYFLLKPFKQPRVVPEILAGIILGPSVLGRSETWAKSIFPEHGKPLLWTAADIGIAYFCFNIGVKMDPVLIFKSGKKPWGIAIMGMLTPLLVVALVAFALKDKISADIANGPFLVFVPASISITAFPNLAHMLAEFELLNTELGQLALSSALINDFFGWFLMGIFTVTDEARRHHSMAFWSFLSIALMIGFVVFVFRPWAQWVNQKIQKKGGHVEERYVLTILLGVLVTSFTSDIIGATVADGPLIMGLAMPDGPPLGAAMLDKSELIVMEVLLPLLYVMCGMSTDLSVINDWKKWAPLVVVIFAGYAGKLVGTMMPSFYCRTDIGSAFVLGLVMSFRGVVEVMTFLDFWVVGLLDNKAYTVLLLSTTTVTAITAPLVVALYKPFDRNGPLCGRSVQQTRPNAELRILACVQSPEPVPSIINLLEALHTTEASPVCVYALHLVELVGRATPLLIPHDNSRHLSDPVLNAFLNYENRLDGCAVVLPFITVSPYKTMHLDIFKLTETKHTALVILPFRRKDSVGGLLSPADQAVRTMIPTVLANSPCTVGILVHGGKNNPGLRTFSRVVYRVALIFCGGPDDREALAVASRMANNEGVFLMIQRFIQLENGGDGRERRLDDESLGEFRTRNMKYNSPNNSKVVVKETVVKDMAESIEVMRSLSEAYDLLIMGRQPHMIAEELEEWSECPELGVFGDMFASVDTENPCSVLVVATTVLKLTK